MATRMGDSREGGEPPLVIDPSAEKPKASRARGGNGKPPPTGKDEEKFFQDTGEEYKLQHRQQDLGWLGKFFGGSNSAPTNIAGLVAVFGLAALVISFMIPANSGSVDAQRLADAQKILVGLISSALSFIFGAASKK